MEILEGKFLETEYGYGFIKIDESEDDIFIGKKYKRNAMNGDIVSVKILESQTGSNREGQIIKVLKREIKQVVGTFKKSDNFGFVIPDDKKIEDIFIPKSGWKKAKTNQKVVVEITKYPEKNRKAEGKIIEILGKIDEAGVDMLSIIRQFGLENEFPKSVLEEAKEVSKESIELEGREDYREKKIFTIDGESAKDLDDAICVDKNDDGTYTLGVHIADVSHYVKSGTSMDREALARGTSVYMLDRVIPMIPKELSNGVCSLNQKEDKYTLSVIMKIDNNGNVIDSDIKKGIINVKKRMNYHEVTAIIQREELLKNKEKNADTKFKNAEYVSKVIKENEEYIEEFEKMRELANILKERRKKEGYLSLDIPESEIILDDKGYPVEISAYENTEANEIIEQFMLTANETVAERFYWLNAPFIYRVHERPDEDKISELNKYLFNLGYKIKGKKDDIKPKAFSQILDEVKGKDEEKVVANLLLRTLKIARYEAENRGHFGIASKYYCHFTSPIRRYPDLFIHRIISKYIEKDYNMKESWIEKYKTNAIKFAEISSECEQNATKAERESEAMKKAEYMEDKIGEEYDGIISSITNFGMFVELDNTIEGLIRFEDMDDYYIYNANDRTLFGKNKNKIYKIGNKVRIKVKYANKETRKIDFELIEE